MFEKYKGSYLRNPEKEILKKYESKVQAGAMDRNAMQGRGGEYKERHLSRPACGALLLQFERLPPKSELFTFFLFFNFLTWNPMSKIAADSNMDLSVFFLNFVAE